MIFDDFDTAVEHYREAAIRTPSIGRYTNLHAEDVALLGGHLDKKTIQNQVKRQGRTKDYCIEDMVRWMIETNRITINNIIRKKAA